MTPTVSDAAEQEEIDDLEAIFMAAEHATQQMDEVARRDSDQRASTDRTPQASLLLRSVRCPERAAGGTEDTS